MQDFKLEFIKKQFADNKLKCKLQKVVSSVEAIIIESEKDFKQLQKFGLYPAEVCLLFVTKQCFPFYSLSADIHLFRELIMDI